MIRLKYNEKPLDPELMYSQKLDYRNPESDVLWWTIDEHLEIKGIGDITDKHIKESLKEKICLWADEARKYAHDKCRWPVKYASVEFWLPEGHFVIYPQDLGKDIDDYMFEMVEGDICSGLKELGALTTFYTGMLD